MTQILAAAGTLSRSVFAHEAGESPNPDELAGAAGRIETRLRERLSELIGLIWFATLIARALRLAQAEIPTLSYVKVNTEEGGLSGIRDFVDVAVSIDDPKSVETGLIAIFAHIIGLLSIFIGEDLAVRLVREGGRSLVTTRQSWTYPATRPPRPGPTVGTPQQRAFSPAPPGSRWLQGDQRYARTSSG